MEWKVFFACAAGKYHLDSDSPCEDAGRFALGERFWVGVVCDGAGSASQGRIGAEHFSRWVCEDLERAAPGWDLSALTVEQLRERLVGLIGGVRERVNELAGALESDLRDFACTLVACLACEDKACFVHIGDGFAICQGGSSTAVLSLPENGEYSEETFFVTDETWRDRVRITPAFDVHPGSVIGLMSDGAAPFAVDRARSGFYRPFLDPVVNYLRAATPADGASALQNLLASERTHEITSDDKSLLLAIRA
jgi:hypothetical protein